MKSLIYTFLFACFISMATSVKAQTEEYDTGMAALLTQYEKATDAEGRKNALQAMNELDKQYKGDAVKRMWKELDPKTSTGADFRRVGLAMAAAGEKQACRWCFKNGAELGDPYCANLMLIEQLTEQNNPEAAMYLFPKMKLFTLPLIHNMALAMFVLDTPESREIARVLAESYIKLTERPSTNDVKPYGDRVGQYDVFDYTEYIFYADSDILKQVGKCWKRSSLGNQGTQIRKFYENNKSASH